MDNPPYETEAELVRALAAREKRMREVAEEMERSAASFSADLEHRGPGFAWPLVFDQMRAWAAKLLEGQDAT